MNKSDKNGPTRWEEIEHQFEMERSNPVQIDFKKEILNRINMDTYKQTKKSPEALISEGFWKRPFIRFGLVYAFGIFTGILILFLVQPSFNAEEQSTKEVKGTLYDSRSFDNMKTADVLQYESALAKAVCNVRYSTKIVEIRVELSSLYPVKSTLEFDLNSFDVLNVQNIQVNDQSNALSASNFIQFNNVGDNKFIVQLLNKNSLPHQIGFKIYQNDAPIYQNSAQVNKE